MRIGLIIEHYDPGGGGAERWAAAFAQYLLQAGHEVHIFTFKCTTAIAPLILHLIPDPGTLIGRAESVEQFVAAFRPIILQDYGTSWSADIFHPQTGSRLLCFQAETAAQAAGQRIRAFFSPRIRWRHHLMQLIERRAMRNASRIIALSVRLQSLFSARHHLAGERLRLVPNGVDTARFSPQKLAPLRADFRAEFGAGNALVCIMIAHNLRLKNLATALRGIALACASTGYIRLLVAGGTPDDAMQNLISELGLAGRVTFLGNIAGIERLYAAADILVHPTRWDACSLATTEAMAAGLPVITTRMDGASDLITDGVNGFVLDDPLDHHRLAQCLGLLSNPATRRRIGDAARRQAANAARQEDNFRAVEAVMAELSNPP